MQSNDAHSFVSPYRDPEMIDPEAFDPAEEQFSASSEQAITTDGAAKLSNRRAPARSSRSSSSMNRSGPEESAKQQTALPASGHGAGSPPQTDIERTFAERQPGDAVLPAVSGLWREEVAKRVEGYRNRRSRKRLAGEFSMRFDFEQVPPAGLSPEAETITAAEPALDETALPGYRSDQSAIIQDLASREGQEAIPASTKITEPLWSEQARASMQETKIIEFPRPLVFPEFVESDPYALAEPVFEKPRILDVPENVGAVPPPLLDIGSEQEETHDDSPPHFELPLRVAPLAQRAGAAVVDVLVVTVASGIFAMILANSIEGLPHSKPVLALALTVPVLFWAVYNYLFLVHAAATPGMTLTHIRVSTFDGRPVPRSLRRWRALLMVLSCASLGFGFLWAVFDQDSLSWHDKMTRTYLTTEP
jgi:uncharacterized RDD family membrane protein YckC